MKSFRRKLSPKTHLNITWITWAKNLPIKKNMDYWLVMRRIMWINRAPELVYITFVFKSREMVAICRIKIKVDTFHKNTWMPNRYDIVNRLTCRHPLPRDSFWARPTIPTLDQHLEKFVEALRKNIQNHNDPMNGITCIQMKNKYLSVNFLKQPQLHFYVSMCFCA